MPRSTVQPEHMQIIDQKILDARIEGMNLSGETLQEEMGNSIVLFIFLRHFGCLFSKEMVIDAKKMMEENPFAPQPIFFYQGTIKDGQSFFRKYWPQARAIADVNHRFYEAFEVRSGGMKEMFGPDVWKCGLRAAAKGLIIGKPIGDPFTLTSVLLAQRNLILWQYHSAHAGDLPSLEKIEHFPEYASTVYSLPR
ncbi:MAG: hypothetical protein ACKOX1_06445 [Ignavibacteria bacterium]